MGKDADGAEEAVAGGMSRRRSGGVGASNGRASSPVMSGTALGRRLGATAAQAAQDLQDTSPQGDGAGKEGGLVLGSGGAVIGESEVDLLRQPLIKATGGLSGLGVSQLSDSDKFSCVVKFLLDFNHFKEVSTEHNLLNWPLL
jgi:hypothetical protein